LLVARRVGSDTGAVDYNTGLERLEISREEVRASLVRVRDPLPLKKCLLE
jgi:hypothetical protein